jgi:hypothetical protein
MVRVIAVAGIVGLVLTGACVPAPPAQATTCDAEALRDLIGRNITVLQTMRFGVTVRIIGPGTMVTEDFSPDRLNIIHDQNGLITDIGCY